MSQSSDIVYKHFKSRNLAGLQAIRHHLGKEELRASTNQLFTDIAQYLDDQGFDGKHNVMPNEYRELLIEIGSLVGPTHVLLQAQKKVFLCNDLELTRCLLNQVREFEDDIIVGQLPNILKNSQFHIARLLMSFYLHRLPAGRRPQRKLSAMELYMCFEAVAESLPFQARGEDEIVEMEIMRLLVDTGFIHHILYLAQTRRFVPCQRFYDALYKLTPGEQRYIRHFHVRKKS